MQAILSNTAQQKIVLKFTILVYHQTNMDRPEEVQQENCEIMSAGRLLTAKPTQTPWYQLRQDGHWIHSMVVSP